MSKKYTEEEIRTIALSLIGKSFKDLKKIDLQKFEDDEEASKNKAFFGHILEEDVYDIAMNSLSRPDFEDANIELKVTPYKKNKNGSLSAKERLVLNIIDYMSEYKNNFENSHFMYKNSRIQIIWYLWEENKKKEDLRITNELFYQFPNEDIETIKKDWEYIIEKIKAGKAHELSEADTMYLGACTKGANKESVRKQPFSNILAKQRAFCFKQSYMTGLVRKYIGDYADVEKILNKNETMPEFIDNIINKYKGKTKTQLMEELNVNSNAKNVLSIIINRMFNVKSDLKNTDEFIKANIVPKTIRIEENGRIIESLSFPYFKFTDVLNIDFEDSFIKESLETTKFMFFVFKKNDNDYVFKGIKLWNMPENIIENNVKSMYNKTKEVIRTGNIVKYIDDRGRRITNFPGLKDNGVCHVRPHGRNSNDTALLPVKDKLTGLSSYTKQCFWLNNSYLKEILKEFDN